MSYSDSQRVVRSCGQILAKKTSRLVIIIGCSNSNGMTKIVHSAGTASGVFVPGSNYSDIYKFVFV